MGLAEQAMPSFIHSFHKCSLATYYESGIVLDGWDISMKKKIRQNSSSRGAYNILIQGEGKLNKR